MIIGAFCVHLFFTMAALFGCMKHQGAAWLGFSVAWGFVCTSEVPPGLLARRKAIQNKCRKWVWCPSAPKHWGFNGWEVAEGATGCTKFPRDGSQGAWSTFQSQHLKLCRDKQLSAVSLNICSAANKGIKSFLLFQIHNLEIKGNNWRYTNTEISILHRLNDPCCRSWKEPLVREGGRRGDTLCSNKQYILCFNKREADGELQHSKSQWTQQADFCQSRMSAGEQKWERWGAELAVTRCPP